jgi:hypothetical protein
MTITKEEAAVKLGCPHHEVSGTVDTATGDVIAMADGSSYILVPEDNPDAGGKTGLMYHRLPHEDYSGTFPVYELTAEEAAAIRAESAEVEPEEATTELEEADPAEAETASPVPVRAKAGKSA